MNLYGHIYLRFVYLPDLRGNRSSDDYIGPFPEANIALKHQQLYGPLDATIVELQTSPDPDHTMTPGQQADYVLGRF
jgi:hypothetical protein